MVYIECTLDGDTIRLECVGEDGPLDDLVKHVNYHCRGSYTELELLRKLKDVVVEVSGQDLTYFDEKITNLPNPCCYPKRWFGDHAKFIIANLR